MNSIIYTIQINGIEDGWGNIMHGERKQYPKIINEIQLERFQKKITSKTITEKGRD